MFHVKHNESLTASMTDATGDRIDASSLSLAARNRLSAFAGLLIRWNPTIKLVSNQDVAHLWTRHIEDALQLIDHMPMDASHAIDLGSGGGFPGLVLALATEVHFDLIESDSRKAAFLQEAVTVTHASATIHASRIEDVALESRSLLTARALAPLSKLLELSESFLAEGGVCLFPKGERSGAEIAEAGKDWIMDLQQMPSRTSPAGRILRITGLRRREAKPA